MSMLEAAGRTAGTAAGDLALEIGGDPPEIRRHIAERDRTADLPHVDR
ncbi:MULTISPECIES: hypothetical protein [Nocardia]|nr:MULTISPECIES: hypothetical protein [Nocardia]